MLLNRSGSYRKCKDRDRPLLLANSRSNLWVIVLGWQKLENPKLFEFSDPTDPCPFLSFFFFSFFFSLSLHFFYFGDQPWHPHPHRRLIFNYGAADSRTRNTFIAAPGIDFHHWNLSTTIGSCTYRTVFRGSFQEEEFASFFFATRIYLSKYIKIIMRLCENIIYTYIFNPFI